jgi:hypothetical protein
MVHLTAVTWRLRRRTMIAVRTGRRFPRSCTRASCRHPDTQCWKREHDKEQQHENGGWSKGTHSVFTYDATHDNSGANSLRSTFVELAHPQSSVSVRRHLARTRVWSAERSPYDANIGDRHPELESKLRRLSNARAGRVPLRSCLLACPFFNSRR